MLDAVVVVGVLLSVRVGVAVVVMVAIGVVVPGPLNLFSELLLQMMFTGEI